MFISVNSWQSGYFRNVLFAKMCPYILKLNIKRKICRTKVRTNFWSENWENISILQRNENAKVVMFFPSENVCIISSILPSQTRIPKSKALSFLLLVITSWSGSCHNLQRTRIFRQPMVIGLIKSHRSLFSTHWPVQTGSVKRSR